MVPFGVVVFVDMNAILITNSKYLVYTFPSLNTNLSKKQFHADPEANSIVLPMFTNNTMEQKMNETTVQTVID